MTTFKLLSIVFSLTFLFNDNIFAYDNNNFSPRIAIGASILPNVTFNSGKYKALNTNDICCNDLNFSNDKFGLGLEINLKVLLNNMKNIPFFDSLSYNITSQFILHFNELYGSNFEPVRKVFFNNELTNLIEKNEISIKYSSLFWIINFEIGSYYDSLNFHLDLYKPKFYFSLGPVIGILLNSQYEQTLSIVKPLGYFYSNGKNVIKKSFDKFENLSSLTFGFNIGFDIFWNFYQIFQKTWSKNFDLGFGLRYIYLVSNIVKSQNINNSNFGVKLNFLFTFPVNTKRQ